MMSIATKLSTNSIALWKSFITHILLVIVLSLMRAGESRVKGQLLWRNLNIYTTSLWKSNLEDSLWKSFIHYSSFHTYMSYIHIYIICHSWHKCMSIWLWKDLAYLFLRTIKKKNCSSHVECTYSILSKNAKLIYFLPSWLIHKYKLTLQKNEF